MAAIVGTGAPCGLMGLERVVHAAVASVADVRSHETPSISQGGMDLLVTFVICWPIRPANGAKETSTRQKGA